MEKKHLGGRFRASVSFDMPTIPPTRSSLRYYIKEALETHGAELPGVDSALSSSLANVTVEEIVCIRRGNHEQDAS